MFYCDSMASWQKGSLENVHLLVREICPKGCDLHALGLTSQEKANLISIHINSYPKEKLHGRSSIQLLHFYNEEMAKKLYDFGIAEIVSDEVILKPYLLKLEDNQEVSKSITHEGLAFNFHQTTK